MAFIALNHRCHLLRAKYFLIHAVSKFFNVSRYEVVSHGWSRLLEAVNRCSVLTTNNFLIKSMASLETVENGFWKVDIKKIEIN
jgi:hypothetical protein